MLIVKHTVTTQASLQTVWKLIENPTTWPTWDTALEYVNCTQEPAIGATGKIKPKNGPEASFVIQKINSPYFFSMVTHLPLAQLEFNHLAQHINGKTHITHTIYLSGFLKYLFYLLMARKIKAALPQVMNNLVQQAEQE